MNILLVSHLVCYPADNGAKMRVINLLRQLARRHQVTLICPPLAEAAAQALRLLLGPHAEVLTAAPPPTNALRAAAALFAPLPRSVLRAHTGSPLAHTLAAQVQKCPPDVLLASDPCLGEYIRAYSGVTRVMDIAAEYGLYIRRLLTHTQGVQRVWWRLRLLKWEAYTRQLARDITLWMVPGEVDRLSLIRQLGAQAQVAIVPNGVDVATNAYTPNHETPLQICHTGALSYAPNYDGIVYFAREIWPELRRRVPGLHLLVTGEHSAVPAALGTAPGVTLTGYVPQVRPIVSGSRALVVPLRLGVGTRLKIMEAMALGTPVVATSLGAEGLAVTHGQNILIADTPIGFAEQVAAVVGSAELRAQLSQGGRRLVEERYAWDVIGDGLLATFDELRACAAGTNPHSQVSAVQAPSRTPDPQSR